MAQKPLEALSNARPSDLEFWGCDEPKCPHCGHLCDISRNEWWKLYEEGEHEVTCPACELDFSVTTRVSYSFSTDQQDTTA